MSIFAAAYEGSRENRGRIKHQITRSVVSIFNQI